MPRQVSQVQIQQFRSVPFQPGVRQEQGGVDGRKGNGQRPIEKCYTVGPGQVEGADQVQRPRPASLAQPAQPQPAQQQGKGQRSVSDV